MLTKQIQKTKIDLLQKDTNQPHLQKNHSNTQNKESNKEIDPFNTINLEDIQQISITRQKSTQDLLRENMRVVITIVMKP